MTIRTEIRTKENVTEIYVFDGAKYLGYVRKFKNTKTETHPWQAIECSIRGSGFACFYGRNGEKRAIKAVVTGRYGS